MEFRHVDLEDGGAFRGVVMKPVDELFQGSRNPLGEDFHIGTLVADRAKDSAFIGKAAHEGAESDTLHDAIYFYVEV